MGEPRAFRGIVQRAGIDGEGGRREVEFRVGAEEDAHAVVEHEAAVLGFVGRGYARRRHGIRIGRESAQSGEEEDDQHPQFCHGPNVVPDVWRRQERYCGGDGNSKARRVARIL